MALFRICVDVTKLNQSVCRECHILPSVEQVLAQIGNAKVFSKLDANSGFWQIELTPESAKLTTFITPYGCFCFNRLPFCMRDEATYQCQRVVPISGYGKLTKQFLPFLADQSKPLVISSVQRTSGIGETSRLLLLQMSKQP